MKYFNGVIVVEGQNDASFLSSFIYSEYVVLNGLEVKPQEIDYLMHIKGRNIVVLSDSDEVGDQIREKVLKNVPNAINIKVDPKLCDKKGKHGVAECKKSGVLQAFSNLLTDEKFEIGTLKNSDLASLNIENSSLIRDFLCKNMHLGVCNNKTLLKRLNFNKKTLKEIKEILFKYGN